jgi:uncharacterized damage-inducible protein DinB
VTGELETLHALLQFQRESLFRKVSGLDDDAARRAFTGTGTSLLWLLKHMTVAEITWLLHRFAGQADIPSDELVPGDSVAALADSYRATWQRSDEVIFSAPSLDQPCREPDGPQVNLRWVLAHLLEETARHAGHADILRELTDGQTGR